MTSNQRPAGPGQTSLLDQFQRTRASFMGLFRAHIDLLKSEINDILGEVKVLATLAGMVLGVALMTAVLMWVGGFLFLGEWLFGSIGWGLAHGFLLGVGLIVALVLAIVGAHARTSIVSFVIALLITIGIAVLCGSNVAYDAVAQLAPNVAQPLGQPGVLALIAGLVIGAILFALLLGFAAGIKGAAAGIVAGAILGAIIGWVIAGAPWTWPPAIGFAITIGLLVWPVINFALAWPSLDPAERFARLYPHQSIEAAHETRAWMEEQWRTRLPTRGNK